MISVYVRAFEFMSTGYASCQWTELTGLHLANVAAVVNVIYQGKHPRKHPKYLFNLCNVVLLTRWRSKAKEICSCAKIKKISYVRQTAIRFWKKTSIAWHHIRFRWSSNSRLRNLARKKFRLRTQKNSPDFMVKCALTTDNEFMRSKE
jgi:hypothetical protein